MVLSHVTSAKAAFEAADQWIGVLLPPLRRLDALLDRAVAAMNAEFRRRTGGAVPRPLRLVG